MVRVALLALPGCIASSLVGPYDVFSLAALPAVLAAGGLAEPHLQPVIVGLGTAPVASFNGLPVVVQATIAEPASYEIVFVPAMIADIEGVLADRAILSWLDRQAQAGACLSSACAGSFVLAATGRLDGRAATTHWNLAGDFAARFPQVRLKPERLLIDEGDVVTAGGISAALDLALYLVARFVSPQSAAQLAKILILDPGRRQQTPYQATALNRQHGDVAILRVQDWLEEEPGRDCTIGGLAELAILGQRTFLRRFKKATGHGPLEYQQRLRVALARKLLETTAVAFEEIAARCGYGDAASLRRLFKRHTGASPSQYRKRFSCLVPRR